MQSYTLKPTSAEEFFTAFIAHAPKITGEPTYDDLRHLRAIIYQNAASVPTQRGGGQHGHLGMIMPALAYAGISQTLWVDPPEPPPQVVIANPNPTQFQISEANRLHAEELKVRREFQNLDRALTRIVVNSIEPLYLKPFHVQHIGLLGKTTKQILTLLIQTYGHILPQELERNYAQLAKPYDATGEPFQVLIERFDEARIFAADGQLPISDAQVINSGIVALKNTGVLDRHIDIWTDKPSADRSTWIQFQTFFQPRNVEYQRGRREHATPQYGLAVSHTADYFQPHVITPTTSDDTYGSPHSNHDILMQANHAAMANMAATQTELLKQLADMQEKFATLAAATTQSTSQRTRDFTPVRRGGRNSTTTTNGGGNKGPNKDPKGYCWTHGYNVAHGHDSKTCRTRAEGHKTEATRSNNMGGNQADHPTN